MRTKEQSRVDEPDGNMDRYEVKRKIGKVSIKISVIKFDDINLNRSTEIIKFRKMFNTFKCAVFRIVLKMK